jgi:hypothetical protein
LVSAAAALRTRCVDDDDDFIAVGRFRGFGEGALCAGFLLDLECGCVAVLGILVMSLRARYVTDLEEADDLSEFVGVEVFLGSLLEWEWCGLARNDTESSKCS